ncbi:CoA ester lyase [Rhodoglobus sp. NPDC076762]
MIFTLGPSILFVPGDRPDRYAKALERADAIIIDLEDAVASVDKAAARAALIANPMDPARTIVRLNPAGTEDHDSDLEALEQTEYRTVMLSKSESVADFDALKELDVIALCETARGVLAATSLASLDCVVALMWGAEDLVASLGGSSSREDSGPYRGVALHARSSVLLAAGAYSKAVIDAVHLDIADLEGLGAEARDAAALGFTATACIHPSQVAIVRESYAPTVEQIASARALLAAAESQPGVFSFEGRMVDGPILRHAECVVARAGLREG